MDEEVEKYVKMIRIGKGSSKLKQLVLLRSDFLWTMDRYRFGYRPDIPGKGIPVGAVENKMKLDNVDPDKLQPYL